jgi:uncharacterized protein (TIGR02271 family)
MTNSVFALFDDRGEAEQAVTSLIRGGIPKETISVIANDVNGEFSGAKTMSATDTAAGAAKGAGVGAAVGGAGGLLLGLGALAIPGIGPLVAAGPIAAALTGAGVGAATGGIIGALTHMGMPKDEAEYFAEGIRRGGYLVAVSSDQDSVCNRAATMLATSGAVDVERRGEHWKKQGFNSFDPKAPPMNTEQVATDRQSIREAAPDMMKFAVVQEDVKVGKREKETGGVRIRSYVTEKPVEIPVQLREEHIVVNRERVDRPAGAQEFETFKEGTTEIREMAEEAVVAKEARVIEEVTIGKETKQRTQTVKDTVRKTDVDVQQVGNSDSMDSSFQQDFQSYYGKTGRSYEEALPAYRFGYEAVNNPSCKGKNWSEVEPQIQREWEKQYPNQQWSDWNHAISHGWQTSNAESGRAKLI